MYRSDGVDGETITPAVPPPVSGYTVLTVTLMLQCCASLCRHLCLSVCTECIGASYR